MRMKLDTWSIKNVAERADSDGKVSDGTQQQDYEEIKATAIDPNTRMDFLQFTKIESDLAADVSVTLGSVTIRIGYSIENDEDPEKLTADADIGDRVYNAGVTATDCTGNNFVNRSIDINVQGRRNSTQIVRLWIKFIPSDGALFTLTNYCVRNFRISYNRKRKILRSVL